eukprot:3786950-Prymnesium_polylepis.2
MFAEGANRGFASSTSTLAAWAVAEGRTDSGGGCGFDPPGACDVTSLASSSGDRPSTAAGGTCPRTRSSPLAGT